MRAVITRNTEHEITVKLTERDLLLLKWSLDLMARNHIIDGTLRIEIDNLRNKLTLMQNSQ